MWGQAGSQIECTTEGKHTDDLGSPAPDSTVTVTTPGVVVTSQAICGHGSLRQVMVLGRVTEAGTSPGVTVTVAVTATARIHGLFEYIITVVTGDSNSRGKGYFKLTVLENCSEACTCHLEPLTQAWPLLSSLSPAPLD